MTFPKITLPSFHDGLLKGFLVSEDEARLFVETVDGTPYTLPLSGVRSFHVNGFAKGNIILDCEVLNAADVSADILIALNHGGTREKALDQLRKVLDEEIYRVFCVSPSYGATLVALVEAIALVEGISID